jgi:hypothetical protein
MSIWEVLPGGGLRLRTENGWIVETPKGGAVYFSDVDHSWTLPDPPPVEPPIEPPPVEQPPTTGNEPTRLERMVKVGSEYHTEPGWQSGAAVVHYTINPNYGDVVEVSFERAIHMPGGIAGNTKTYRAWHNSPGGQGNQNFYFGTPDGSWKFVWVEYVSGAIRHSTPMPPTDGQFHLEKYVFTMPSGPGKTDGKLSYSIDGVQVANGTSWKLDDTDKPGLQRYHCIQLDTPSWNPPTESWMKIRNVSFRVNP